MRSIVAVGRRAYLRAAKLVLIRNIFFHLVQPCFAECLILLYSALAHSFPEHPCKSL